jgi:hypothetical protein
MFLLHRGVYAVFFRLVEIISREAKWLGKTYELNLLPFFDFTNLDLTYDSWVKETYSLRLSDDTANKKD